MADDPNVIKEVKKLGHLAFDGDAATLYLALRETFENQSVPFNFITNDCSPRARSKLNCF